MLSLRARPRTFTNGQHIGLTTGAELNMSDAEDTEILLALLASLLEHPVSDQSLLLDALVQSEGDVERAARSLNKSGNKMNMSLRKVENNQSTVESPKKRKRSGGLDGWLMQGEAKRPNTDASPGRGKAASSIEDSLDMLGTASALEKPDFVEGTSKTRAATTSSPLRVKPVSRSEFMSILQQPQSKDGSSKSAPSKLPPLTLATPEMVAKHTPCTMHLSVLPPELACRLYYALIDCSKDWQRNKWWLFDRVVESPHSTSFFIRRAGWKESDMKEAAQFWYNGRLTPQPEYFPPEMEEACEYVERVVNAEMRKRERYPLEWGGEPDTRNRANPISGNDEHIIWRANVAASNRYDGASESVGFHTDQLTNLGPYPTIASVSLGTTRVFRLREVVPTDEKDKRSARTYNIPLPHNSLTIMHASCQERFKHSVPSQAVIDPFHPPFPRPEDSGQDQLTNLQTTGRMTPAYNTRINITFRFYRPDYQPSSIPRCKCGVPCILRPDMKNRYTEDEKRQGKKIAQKYWWTCYAGAQNDGKGCNFWHTMDVKAEGRGPFAGDITAACI